MEDDVAQKLYKFHWDCGRKGSLDGLFFADEDELSSLIGKEIYFGDVLGKHSDVYGELELSDIEAVDIPQDAVDVLIGAFGGGTIYGYNPFDYYDVDGKIDDEDEG